MKRNEIHIPALNKASNYVPNYLKSFKAKNFKTFGMYDPVLYHGEVLYTDTIAVSSASAIKEKLRQSDYALLLLELLATLGGVATPKQLLRFFIMYVGYRANPADFRTALADLLEVCCVNTGCCAKGNKQINGPVKAVKLVYLTEPGKKALNAFKPVPKNKPIAYDCNDSAYTPKKVKEILTMNHFINAMIAKGYLSNFYYEELNNVTHTRLNINGQQFHCISVLNAKGYISSVKKALDYLCKTEKPNVILVVDVDETAIEIWSELCKTNIEANILYSVFTRFHSLNPANLPLYTIKQSEANPTIYEFFN